MLPGDQASLTGPSRPNLDFITATRGASSVHYVWHGLLQLSANTIPAQQQLDCDWP